MYVFYHLSLPPDTEKRAQYIEEERQMREENIRLQRKLQREMERREALCRQLSESESSLEMDDERCINYTQIQKMTGLMTLCIYMINFENNQTH